MRTTYTFTCAICNAQFRATYSLAKYCSASCKWASHYKRTGPKKRNRTPVPRSLVNARVSEFQTCADCGIENCGCRHPAYAPSEQQIAAAAAEARRLHLLVRMGEA